MQNVLTALKLVLVGAIFAAGVGHAAAGGTAAGATLRDNLGGGSDAFGGFSLAGLVRARSMVVVIQTTVTSNV